MVQKSVENRRLYSNKVVALASGLLVSALLSGCASSNETRQDGCSSEPKVIGSFILTRDQVDSIITDSAKQIPLNPVYGNELTSNHTMMPDVVIGTINPRQADDEDDRQEYTVAASLLAKETGNGGMIHIDVDATEPVDTLMIVSGQKPCATTA